MKKQILIFALFLIGCQTTSVTNFEECLAAGNPAMESYPRQCRHGDQTFTEIIAESDSHICTAEEKAAEICTLDYTPVCGDNGRTYGNGCQACASGQIDSYVPGECS
ncbi:hypothetical protein GOV09_00135 [Candidatus Woesearchaeota archaeon]|nr:hypothetical protein [Candidatus Woesearchaeota archaeon]